MNRIPKKKSENFSCSEKSARDPALGDKLQSFNDSFRNTNQPEGRVASISVITATLNASKTINELAWSLLCQSDQAFEWIVCDGGSDDNTLEIVERYHERLNLKTMLHPGFGIYDAINQAICACRCDYYVVIGADDVLFPNAISEYRRKMFGYDLVAFGVFIGKKIKYPRRDITSWSGFAAHSIGTVIRKNLHERVGFYQQRYEIAADTLFLRMALNSGASVASHQELVGCFSLNGVSSSDYLKTAIESFRIRIEMGENKVLCSLRLGVGIAKNISRIVLFGLGRRRAYQRIPK